MDEPWVTARRVLADLLGKEDAELPQGACDCRACRLTLADTILANVVITQDLALEVGAGATVVVEGVPVVGPRTVPGRIRLTLPRSEPLR